VHTRIVNDEFEFRAGQSKIQRYEYRAEAGCRVKRFEENRVIESR